MVENLGANLSFLAIFTEGLLSFLSPCIFPLIPLYLSYLSADAKEIDEEGDVRYRTGKVFLTTLFFVLGISVVFLLYGVSFSLVKEFLDRYHEVFTLVGGMILILFAFHYFGLVEWKFLQQEKRLPFRLEGGMNYGKAFLFGFFFSFAWTPCIGPILSSVLLLAASNSSYAVYYLLAYVAGLTSPFLLLGIFTKGLLEFFKKKKNIVHYTMKIAAVILLVFGLNLFADGVKKIDLLKNINSHNTSVKNEKNKPSSENKEGNANTNANQETETETKEEKNDFRSLVFKDQNGNTHQLKDDEGEVVYVSFVATWCHYCQEEIPHFEAFLKEKKVKGYYVMSPVVNRSMGSVNVDLQEYAEEHGMKAPILIDEEGVLFEAFQIRGYPTLVILDPYGKPFTPIPGFLNEEKFHYLHGKVLEKIKEMEEKK